MGVKDGHGEGIAGLTMSSMLWEGVEMSHKQEKRGLDQ